MNQPPRQDLPSRVVTGLAKVGLALRHKSISEGSAAGLSPTQAQILVMLRSRGGLALKDIADLLAVRAATASEAVKALERKGFVRKEKGQGDARSIRIVLTPAGEAGAERAAAWPDFLLRAVETLNEEEQRVFLRGLVKMIQSLQERGEIPVSRMCVSCRFFRANAHKDPDRPHHCDFVDGAFGDSEIRVDCPDFELTQIHQ
ncbi:MAG: MarR family winged helix-turn-helix transcriptional regulator [Bryobacteraceae bacterium]